MIIARIGNFDLSTATYITKHETTTHELNICKWYVRDGEEYKYVIASFNEEGELVSCGDRLIKDIGDEGDWEAVSSLAKIAYSIINNTEAATLDGKLVD